MPIIFCYSNGALAPSPMSCTAESQELVLKLPAPEVMQLKGSLFANLVAVTQTFSVTEQAITITTSSVARFVSITLTGITANCSFRVKFWQYGAWQSLSVVQPYEVANLTTSNKVIELGVDTDKLFLERVTKDTYGVWSVQAHGLTQAGVSVNITEASVLKVTLPNLASVSVNLSRTSTDIASQLLPSLNAYLLNTPGATEIPVIVQTNLPAQFVYDLSKLQSKYQVNLLSAEPLLQPIVTNPLQQDQVVATTPITQSIALDWQKYLMILRKSDIQAYLSKASEPVLDVGVDFESTYHRHLISTDKLLADKNIGQVCQPGDQVAQGFAGLSSNLLSLSILVKPLTAACTLSCAIFPDLNGYPDQTAYQDLAWEHHIANKGDVWPAQWLEQVFAQPASLDKPWWLVISLKEGSALFWLRKVESAEQASGGLGRIYRKAQASGSWVNLGFSVPNLAGFTQLQLLDEAQVPQFSYYYQNNHVREIIGTAASGSLNAAVAGPLMQKLQQGSDAGFIGLYANVAGQLSFSKLNLGYVASV